MRSPIKVWIVAICLGVSSPVAAGDGRAIYRCEVDGLLTFSDRPCAPSAAKYELDPEEINTYEAPPKASRASPKRPKPRRTRQRADPAADLAKQKQLCERLAQGLKDIRSKFRAGYTASEGERLKVRQEKLKSQLRMAQCG